MNYKPYFRFTEITIKGKEIDVESDAFAKRLKRDRKFAREVLNRLYSADTDEQDTIHELLLRLGWRDYFSSDLTPERLEDAYGIYEEGMEDLILDSGYPGEIMGEEVIFVPPKQVRAIEATIKKLKHRRDKEEAERKRKLYRQDKEAKKLIKNTVDILLKRFKRLNPDDIDVKKAETTNSYYVRMVKKDKLPIVVRVSDHPPNRSSTGYTYSIHMYLDQDDVTLSDIKSGFESDLKKVIKRVERYYGAK